MLISYLEIGKKRKIQYFANVIIIVIVNVIPRNIANVPLGLIVTVINSAVAEDSVEPH